MHAAFTKNGMNESLTPCSFSTRSLSRSRSAMTRRHVDLVERREMRRRVLRLEEILGDALAARRHLLARLALRLCAARGRAAAAGACGDAALTKRRRCRLSGCLAVVRRLR